MDVSNIIASFGSLKQNPEGLLSLIDKHVQVYLIKNTSFSGFVHSVDPISLSIFLSVPQADSIKTVLIPGHAITDIKQTEPISNIRPPDRTLVTTESPQDILLRKNKVIAWLKWNLLPVLEEDEKIIFGNASLLPPYSITDICTDNPMVAMQMRKVIEAMPEDFEPH